ncbi:hypothetical protein ACJX0J_040384, partial [Zea mays]
FPYLELDMINMDLLLLYQFDWLLQYAYCVIEDHSFFAPLMENHNPLHSQIAEVKMDISASASVAAGNKFCKGAAYYFSDSSNSSKDAKERSTSMRKLIITVILCIIFMMVEVVGGIKANSLAILTDAAHLLSDVAAFAITIEILGALIWLIENTSIIKM